MIIHMMEQNTPEWDEVRKLKFTASSANTILAMGKGVETLVYEMLADYYSSGNYEEYSGKYKNEQMQRGHDFEERARSIYELETGNEVTKVGFVEISDYVGCSPDGLVNNDGLLEIKNHSDVVFLRLLESKKIEKKYIDQMQFQMYVTGGDWCDYFAFNPNFNPCYIKIRINKDMETQAKITEALAHATKLLKAKKTIFDTMLQVA